MWFGVVGEVKFGMLSCFVVWYSFVWCIVVWRGVAWRLGESCRIVVRYCLLCRGRRGVVCSDFVMCSAVLCGVEWCGVVCME